MKAWLARSVWVIVAAVVLLVGMSSIVVAAGDRSSEGCDAPDAGAQPVYPMCCFAGGVPLSNCVLTGAGAGVVLPSSRPSNNSEASLRDCSTALVSQTISGTARLLEWPSDGGVSPFPDTGYRCRNSLSSDEPPFCLTIR